MDTSYLNVVFKNFETAYKPPTQIDTNKFVIVQNISDPKVLCNSDNDIEHTIFVANLNTYVNKIKKDFPTPKIIWKQFCIDIPRCELYVNNILVKNPNLVLHYFSCQYSEEVAHKVMMLCTQASMGFPCEILYNMYRHMNLYIAEPENTRYFNIKLYVNSESIYFIIEKNMRLINENGVETCVVCIRCEFDVLCDDLMYLTYCC